MNRVYPLLQYVIRQCEKMEEDEDHGLSDVEDELYFKLVEMCAELEMKGGV